MSLTKTIKAWGIGLLIITHLVACTDHKSNQNSSANSYSAYIVGFSSDGLSTSSDIKIEFANDIPLAQQQSLLTESIFAITPKIKGNLYWSNNRTLSFLPEEDLKPNSKYSVQFNLGKLYDVPNALKKFVFDFHTEPQNLKYGQTRLKYYTIDRKKTLHAQGYVSTRSKVDPKVIKKLVKAFIDDKPTHINWLTSSDYKHIFTIDSITRLDQPQELIIDVSGQALGLDMVYKDTLTIPNNKDFSVLQSIVEEGEEQSIKVIFSEILDPNQNLTGAISLGTAKYTTQIESNSLTIFPRQRLEGQHRLTVFNTIKSMDKNNLNRKYSRNIPFKTLLPQLQLADNGVILPSSKGLHFGFKAVNLSTVQVKIVRIFEHNIEQFFQDNNINGQENIKRVGRLIFNGEIKLDANKNIDLTNWNRFDLKLDKYFEAEPGAIYRVYVDFDQYNLLNPCKDLEPRATFAHLDLRGDQSLKENDTNYWAYNGYQHSHSWRGYDHNEANNPCSPSFYMRDSRGISQNIFCSNLGLIVKSNDYTQMTVATTDLITSAPLSQVTIEATNFQGQLVGKGITDNNGLLQLELNSPAFLVRAIRNHERTYVRVDDGSALSTSMFSVNGSKHISGVKGFIYGERDVWRPGDSIYLNLIVQNSENTIPTNHPIHFKLINPKNQIIEEKIVPFSTASLYSFITSTPKDALTGAWKAKIDIGPFKFSAPIKIETIRPNRLKINLDFESNEIKIKNKKIIGKIKSTWLHGADASHLQAKVDMKLINTKTTFKQYENYIFDDRLRQIQSTESNVLNSPLNEQGEATIKAKIQLNSPPPGKFTANFTSKVYEKGGGFSSDLHSVKVSPFSSYVGVYAPKGSGWRGALFNNVQNKFSIVCVDEKGTNLNVDQVKVEIYRYNHRWWWDHSNHRSNYIQNDKIKLINSVFINIKNGNGEFILPTSDSDYGSYIIRVIDPESGHAASTVYRLTYDWRSGHSSTQAKEGLTMLTFDTDKDQYNPGDVAHLQIPTSADGHILVSVEKGTQIINQFWVKNTKGNTKIDLPITYDMTPNIYIHLTLVQPYENSENDLPVRLYGVKPLTIIDENSLLKPQITCAEKWEPEKSVSIKVSEKNGEYMEYTLAIVDEGLLDLTGFKTPDPWKSFYAKEALGIKTWDMYDQVIGSFNGHIAGLLSVGGDGVSLKTGAAKANRFPPVVKFLGPFELKKDATKEHQITLPNYIGSVRVMVVASNASKYGHTEKNVAVKKPLMVLANLPRVLGPGEKLSMPVTIFAMEKDVKNVQINLSTNGLINLNNKNKKINFNKIGDQQVYFDLEVDENIGIGKVTVTARSGKHVAREEIEIDIRSANPLIHSQSSVRIDPGEKWEGNYDVSGLKGSNEVKLEATNQLPLNLSKRLDYLIRYPHGCIEQTTSSAFPQLAITHLMEVSPKQQSAMEKNIKSAIKRIHSFQLHNGGIGYWPNATQASPWGSNYAGHFMLEAQRIGYSLPSGYLNNWIGYQKKIAESWLPSDYGRRDHGSYRGGSLMQAYRLYTLALAGDPAIGAMNRMKNSNQISVQAKYRLALAYQLIGQKEIAKEMVRNLTTDIPATKSDSRTFGSTVRDMAMILESLHEIGDHTSTFKMADLISKELNSSNWLSTQSTSYMLLALAKFNGSQKKSDINLSYSIDDNTTQKLNSPEKLIQLDLSKEYGKHSISIHNNSSSTLFTNLNISGIPLNEQEKEITQHLDMKVKYVDVNNKPIQINNLNLGTDFYAKVTITHIGLLQDYQELALTQIFPSGWEIHNDRLNDTEVDLKSSDFDFQDIRDDRVNTYFDLKRGESKVFITKFNASFPGTYYLPAINCEAMYDHDITATRKGQWIQISSKN